VLPQPVYAYLYAACNILEESVFAQGRVHLGPRNPRSGPLNLRAPLCVEAIVAIRHTGEVIGSWIRVQSSQSMERWSKEQTTDSEVTGPGADKSR